MRRLYSSCFGFLVLAAVACTPSTDESLSPDAQPVVQAYLTPNQPVSVAVTRQIPFVDDTTGQGQPIDGLTLSVAVGTQAYPLHDIGNGTYQSGGELKVKTGQTYQLNFDYSGRHISGSTIIPSRPVSFSTDQTEIYRPAIALGSGNVAALANQSNIPVHLTWSNPTGDYYFVIVDNLEANPVPIITRPNNTTATVANNRRFRSSPIQSDNTTIQPLNFQYFGLHRMVLFHINPDYAALYKQNSTSTQNISTPPTALTNGLGLFTGLNADTLFVTVKPL